MTKRRIRTFEAKSDEQSARWDKFAKDYGFATFSDFMRTAADNFCDALKHARLGWQPPEVNDEQWFAHKPEFKITVKPIYYNSTQPAPEVNDDEQG